MPWRLRLHHRIVIPFAVVAFAATAATAFLTLSLVSRAFETRILSQILNTSEVISRGGFAFNPAIIRSVKSITGAEVLTFDAAGTVVSTTIDSSRSDLIRAVIGSAAVGEAHAAGGAVVREMSCDAPCYVSYRPIADRPGVMLAIVMEGAESIAAVRAVSRSIALAALASMAALVLVSQFVARRVTAPIESLVRFSQDVGSGSSRRAVEGDDDIGRLGGAFNQMLDRLDESKALQMRNEKLALAGLFAARVAHDIRNPLASMKINMQLLEPAVSDDANRAGLVQAVLHDIAQVEGVIRDLIETARPSELRRVPADLNVVVRTLMRQLQGRLTHRKVIPQLHLPDHLPLVMTDTERFSQALLNVIINASDAMPNGGPLTITTQAADGGVIIDVDDEGVGIDPALADRVFDPFVSSKHDGVGLGLVNARAVVEGHGGKISLAPRQPRGTRARIVMPAS